MARLASVLLSKEPPFYLLRNLEYSLEMLVITAVVLSRLLRNTLILLKFLSGLPAALSMEQTEKKKTPSESNKKPKRK